MQNVNARVLCIKKNSREIALFNTKTYKQKFQFDHLTATHGFISWSLSCCACLGILDRYSYLGEKQKRNRLSVYF